MGWSQQRLQPSVILHGDITMRIYGAGLAGLLAANMLRRYKPEVHEAQPSLPNNHEALLRFRSDAVARATGIPFRKVLVHKAILYRGQLITTPNLRLSNMYSQKVTGEVANRSILSLDSAERFIAPPNLIELLANSVDLRYNSPLPFAWSGQTWLPDSNEAIISTIPMPVLMDLAHWSDKPLFSYKTITSFTCDIVEPKIDVYQTLYNPDRYYDWYRASITGSHLIIEMMGENPDFFHTGSPNMVESILAAFGIQLPVFVNGQVKVQRYGKISPIEDSLRRTFILSMSDQYGIYSLGRYATWRNILLDDVVRDVEVVNSFITQRGAYARKLREPAVNKDFGLEQRI
jgi:hypothetical protein